MARFAVLRLAPLSLARRIRGSLQDQVSSSAVWIEGTNKQFRLIYFGQIGRTLSAHVAEYGIYSKAHVLKGPGESGRAPASTSARMDRWIPATASGRATPSPTC